jgi:hypothetical protein
LKRRRPSSDKGVIASEAKQSSVVKGLPSGLDCFVGFASSQ